MIAGHELQDVREPGKRLEVVKFVVAMRVADGCPLDGATVGAREQLVFGAERDSTVSRGPALPVA
jgi:hypothetical protein